MLGSLATTVFHKAEPQYMRLIIIPNRTFLVRFGGISGEFGRAMVRILARRSRAKIPMARPTSLICCRSVPKKVRLGIYRTQIRPKTQRYFFSYRDQSGVVSTNFVERHVFTLFWSSILFCNSSSVSFFFHSFVWRFIFGILEVQIKREIWKIRFYFETKKFQRFP